MSNADYYRTIEGARADLISCNQRAKFPYALSAADFEVKLAEKAEKGWDTASLEHRYKWLGWHSLEALTSPNNGTPLTKQVISAAESGFDVLARLLSFAPEAYLAYCREKGEAVTVENMGSALKGSTATPRRFMDVPNAINKELEYAFGLRNYTSGFRSEYLRFEDTHRGPLFVADDQHFARNFFPDEELVNNAFPVHWQRCPAKRLVTERIWPAMVDLAVEAPEVFPHHLEMAARI